MLLVAPALLAAALAAAPQAEFLSQWNDWKAELDGYRLAQPRYGELRHGDAILIFVTEPFSLSKLVKPDRPDESSKDEVQVLKLNELRHFQTGIYDYALMTSVFEPLRFGETASSKLNPLKIAFSGQEWCGTVYEELRRTSGGYHDLWHSYFESDGSGDAEVALPDNTLVEDELLLRARELFAKLAPGRYGFLAGLRTQRLSHQRQALGSVTVARAEKTERIKVPAGEFETVRWDFDMSWGKDKALSEHRSIWIEAGGQKRVIAWEGDVAGFGRNEPGKERAELTGSIRDTYWQHNHVADDGLRAKLGLPSK